MRIELSDIFQALPARGLQHGNAAPVVSSEGYVDSLFRRIVSHIVGVFSHVHSIEEFERISIVDSELSIGTVRDEELIELAYENYALRVGGPGNAVYVAARKRVYDFDRVIAESSPDDAFPLSVEREMVDTASHVRQWNLLD